MAVSWPPYSGAFKRDNHKKGNGELNKNLTRLIFLLRLVKKIEIVLQENILDIEEIFENTAAFQYSSESKKKGVLKSRDTIPLKCALRLLLKQKKK